MRSFDAGMMSARTLNASVIKVDKSRQQVRHIKGIAGELLVDDDDCTMVLQFPRAKCAGGPVNPREVVEEPWEEARKIFYQVDNPQSLDTLDRLQIIRRDETCSMEDFQSDIRGIFMEVLEELGVEASQFPSIDGDEDFLKINLRRDGSSIRYFAEQLKYEMAYLPTAYESLEGEGPYPGHEPMRNTNGDEIVAYGEYVAEQDHLFQRFEFVDKARILALILERRVSLEQMVRSDVLTSYFFCPKADKMEALYADAAYMGNFYKMPGDHAEDQIRSYFGEEIAFFFKFFSYLTRAMAVLGLLGLAESVAEALPSVLPPKNAGAVRVVLCVLFTLWATMFMQLFGRSGARVQQKWGVSEEERRVHDLPDWDHTQNSRAGIVNGMALVYLALYVAVIEYLLGQTRYLAEHERKGSMQYTALALSVVIKGGSFLWGKIAPCLVNFANHRSRREYQLQLTGLMAAVKIFVALWPFVVQCFLSKELNVQCRPKFNDLVAHLWNVQGLEGNTTLLDLVPRGPLDILRTNYVYVDGKGDFCVYGCYPPRYEGLERWTPTNCQEAATLNLRTYFLFQIATEFLFLFIAIALTTWEVSREVMKVKDKDSEGEPSTVYSLLQAHAKCPKYELESWSGSLLEDFLDVAICYAVVVAFGVVTPLIAVFCTMSFMVSYRLRLFRTTYIAQRPFPRASAGLGAWKPIFDWINIIAVIINVALLNFFFYPASLWNFRHQALSFVMTEHAILLLRAMVDFIIPDQPLDVRNIGHYNAYFKKSLANSRAMLPPGRSDLRSIDLSLNPDGISDDEEDSATE